MRLHLVEIHDLAACPPSLRNALTDFLAFTENVTGAYDPVGPLLRRAIECTKARRIVDLCAGAGGPWRRLAAEIDVPVVLTDLYPHGENVTRVDARAVPAEELGGIAQYSGGKIKLCLNEHARPACAARLGLLFFAVHSLVGRSQQSFRQPTFVVKAAGPLHGFFTLLHAERRLT